MRDATSRFARPRRNVALALFGLSLLTVALSTRLPFSDRTFFISDSVRYALALEDYDMTAGRPHPPGSPLYVAAVSALDRLVGDPALSFALFSALASGAAFFFAYLLGRDLAGISAGLLASAILVVSPLFWYFGGLAMPSTGEAALSLAVAWLARRARSPGQSKTFWALTAVLAAAYGFRSTFAVLMIPLWIYAGWWHPKKRIAAGAAVLVAAAFAWTLSVALLSGGWEAYRQTSSAFLTEVVIATKIASGGLAKIPRQARDIAISASLGLGPFLLPFLGGVYLCVRRRGPFPGAAPFVAAWALPAVLFHAAYDWAPRFGVLLLPPAAVLAAAAAVPLARRVWRQGGRFTAATADWRLFAHALVLLGLAVNLAVFLLPVRLGPFTLPDAFPSGTRLLARNADLDRRDAAIREAFEPSSTLILAYEHTFHAAYFLPDYPVVGLFPVFRDAPDNWVPSARGKRFSFEPGSSALPATNPLRIPESVDRILLYDPDYLAVWPSGPLPLRSFAYDLGKELRWAELSEAGCLHYDYRAVLFFEGGGAFCAAGAEATP